MKNDSPPGVLTWLITIVVTCAALFFFQQILWLVVPCLSALVLYYCLRPLMRALVQAGLKHRAAAVVVAGVLFLATVLTVILFLPIAASHAIGWKELVVRYVQGGLDFGQHAEESLARKVPMPSILRNSTMNLDALTGQFAEKYLGSLLLQMVHWLPSLLLMPYLTYFLLQDGNRFKKHLISSVPNAFFEKTLLLVDRIDDSLQNFFIGLMKLTFLDTVCLAFGLWLLGISFPLLLGFVAAVFAWVPYVGSVAGCILVVLVAATDFPGQPAITYSCIALFLCVRMLDDFVFLPLTIGRSLRIHPVMSVLMLFLGAAVAGPTGLFLVLPVWGVVTIVTETLGQIVTDPRLLWRFRHARHLRMRLVDAP